MITTKYAFCAVSNRNSVRRRQAGCGHFHIGVAVGHLSCQLEILPFTMLSLAQWCKSLELESTLEYKCVLFSQLEEYSDNREEARSDIYRARYYSMGNLEDEAVIHVWLKWQHSQVITNRSSNDQCILEEHSRHTGLWAFSFKEYLRTLHQNF